MPGSRIVDLSHLQTFTAVNLLSDGGAIGGPTVVPNCLQVSIVWALDSGKQGHMVTYGRYSSLPANLVTVANGILAGLDSGGAFTALAAFISASQSLSFVTVRDVNVANQPIVQATLPGANGTSASPSLPNEVAAVITLRTALVGRAARGRMYVPGWATNALGAGNIIAAAAVTALQNWANTFTSVYAGQGLTFSLGLKARQQYTGRTGTVHPARAATSLPITSTPVRDNHWDSQRRRGLK